MSNGDSRLSGLRFFDKEGNKLLVAGRIETEIGNPIKEFVL